jgi:ABC-type sugar transport system ATPase subunit
MAREGGAVIVVSSEVEELIAVCDRVMVLAQGRLVGEVSRGPELTTSNLLHAAFHFSDGGVTQDAIA